MALERSSIGNVRKDKLRNILNLFKDTTDETELSKLCEDLINTINEGDKVEQQSALSEATQILVGEIDAKVSGEKIFLSICKQVGKLDVIPLIAEIITEPSNWWMRNYLDNANIMNVSFCKDLIAAAGSNSRHLKLVLTILMEFAPSSTFLEVFPNLLVIITTLVEDESLVNRTLEAYVDAIKNYEDCQDRDILMECRLLTSISVLTDVLFSKIPNSMDLYRKLDHNSTAPSCCLLVSAVLFTIDPESGFKDFDAAFKIMRVILPIISHVIDFIIQNFVQWKRSYTTGHFLSSTSNLLTSFVSLTENNRSDAREALELFISSKLMENWLTLQETATRMKICCFGTAGPYGSVNSCFFFKGVEATLLLLTQSSVEDLSIKEGGFVLLRFLKHFLLNEHIYLDEDGREIDYAMAYGDACIVNLERLFFSCPHEFRQCLWDPEENLLPLIVRFASRHPSLSYAACNFIMKIVQILDRDIHFCCLLPVNSQ